MLRKEIDEGKLWWIMKYLKEVEWYLFKIKIISSKSCEKFLFSLKIKLKRKNSFVIGVDSFIELIRKVMLVCWRCVLFVYYLFIIFYWVIWWLYDFFNCGYGS